MYIHNKRTNFLTFLSLWLTSKYIPFKSITRKVRPKAENQSQFSTHPHKSCHNCFGRSIEREKKRTFRSETGTEMR